MTTSTVVTQERFVPVEISYDAIIPTYNPIEFIDGIPVGYFLSRLHEHGHEFLNDINSAYAELHIQGLSTPFWIHKEYLESQSTFFNRAFKELNRGDKMVIKIPSPEDFEPLLEYLYTGDGDKWYDTMNPDNYYDVWSNVEFFGLGLEARAICIAYYQNEVLNNSN